MISKNVSIATPSLELLVVEDDKVISMLQKKVIQTQTSFPVSVFENGKLALDHIIARPSVYFLVLLDINMPVMNGWDFLEELQLQDQPRFKVAMVTSSINQLDRTTAFKFPQVVAYYEKPLLRENVREFFELDEVRTLMAPPGVI